MKYAGMAMLVSGWIVVIGALCLLPSPALRACFIGAGMLVEALGLFLVGRAHYESRGEYE